MCLASITKRAGEMPAAAIGYKVVDAWDDGMFPCFMRSLWGYRRGVGVGQGWAIRDDASYVFTDAWIEPDVISIYWPGVHAYKHLSVAKAEAAGTGCRVVRVYLRGPIAEGKQRVGSSALDYTDVIVYREMTIIEVIE